MQQGKQRQTGLSGKVGKGSGLLKLMGIVIGPTGLTVRGCCLLELTGRVAGREPCQRAGPEATARTAEAEQRPFTIQQDTQTQCCLKKLQLNTGEGRQIWKKDFKARKGPAHQSELCSYQ